MIGMTRQPEPVVPEHAYRTFTLNVLEKHRAVRYPSLNRVLCGGCEVRQEHECWIRALARSLGIPVP